MNDEFFEYYNRELIRIRQDANHFAQQYPKVAARLRLGADGSEDPHVERLLEGFAFLTADIRQQLDDGEIQLAQALMSSLYPHYLNPVPSTAIVQLHLDANQKELASGLTIPRGKAIQTPTIQGEPCRFVTCYDTELWPVDLTVAELRLAPFQAPLLPSRTPAVAVLHLKIQGRSNTLPLSRLSWQHLRLYLHGPGQTVHPIYELLFRQTIQVAFAQGPEDRQPSIHPASILRPVGFESNQALYPFSAQSQPGYRLLCEYFRFSRKFHFVDLQLPKEALAQAEQSFDVYIYLKEASGDLENRITPENFRLGCTPIVNLYPMRAEPIRWTQTTPAYRIVPDVRRPLSHEVYSVVDVSATSSQGDDIQVTPYFSTVHADERDAVTWQLRRRATQRIANERDTSVDRGSEVELKILDPENRLNPDVEWTFHVQIMALNRDLPGRLPFGGGQPQMRFLEGGAGGCRIECLTAPTLTHRPSLQADMIWKLISHLSLNHLSLIGGAQGASVLREILSLYDQSDRPEIRNSIEGIQGVESRRVTGRLDGIPCRGVEITLTYDETRFAGQSLLLFTTVLHEFLRLSASLNTFTRTVAKVINQEQEYHRWPAQHGTRIIL